MVPRVATATPIPNQLAYLEACMAGTNDTTRDADVAQSEEAPDLKSGQCGFESRRPHQYHYINTLVGVCTLRRRGRGDWTLRVQRNGKRIERSLRTTSLKRAEAIATKIAPALMGYGYSEDKRAPGTAPNEGNYRRLFRETRRRALKNGIDFELTPKSFLSIVARANGHCELTEIPFSMLKRTDWFRAPYSPSIDRINPKHGYTNGNVRLLCVAVNWALQDWGEEVFEIVCLGFLRGWSGAKVIDYKRKVDECPGILRLPALA